jgi:Family of unknown function (DUF6941)
MLCDAAQEMGGKLFILGGGWSQLNQPNVPTPMSLAIIIKVPWDQANEKHGFEAVLMTADGDRVEFEGNEVSAQGEFETGRPAGLKRGTDLDLPAVLSFNGLALPAGGYRWEVFVDGTQMAVAPFRVNG